MHHARFDGPVGSRLVWIMKDGVEKFDAKEMKHKKIVLFISYRTTQFVFFALLDQKKKTETVIR